MMTEEKYKENLDKAKAEYELLGRDLLVYAALMDQLEPVELFKRVCAIAGLDPRCDLIDGSYQWFWVSGGSRSREYENPTILTLAIMSDRIRAVIGDIF